MMRQLHRIVRRLRKSPNPAKRDPLFVDTYCISFSHGNMYYPDKPFSWHTVTRLLFLLLALAHLSFATAQVPVMQWKASVYGANGGSSFVGNGDQISAKQAMAMDASGNIYLTATSVLTDGTHNFLTIKYSPQGAELWRAVMNNGSAGPAALALDGDGSVVVTGNGLLPGGTNADILTVKYSATGQELWRAIFATDPNLIETAIAVALDGAGNVYVLGVVTPERGTGLIKYDKNGNEIWRLPLGPGSNLRPIALAVDAVGTAYVTGRDRYCAIQQPRLCNVGTQTTKYSAEGSVQWQRYLSFDVAFPDLDFYPSAITVDSQGGVVLAGTGIPPHTFSSGDLMTAKYSAAGDELWATFTDAGAAHFDLATDVVVGTSGNIFATGKSTVVLPTGFQSSDVLTIGYNQAGQPLWQSGLNGAARGEDIAYAIALDTSENPYIVGSSHNGTDFDLLIARYSATTGAEQWRTVYKGSRGGSDQGRQSQWTVSAMSM